MRYFTRLITALFIFWAHVSTAQNIPGVYTSAGMGQSICGSWQASLSGSIGDSVTSPVWTTSGDGTFDDSSTLDATYTPGTSDIASGSATLTLTANRIGSGVTVSDYMVLTIIASVPAQPEPVTGAPVIACPPLNGIVLRTNKDPRATNYTWSSVHPGTYFVPPSTADTQSVNILPTTSAEYVINVTAFNLCGASPARSVHIKRIVKVSALNGASIACANTTKPYTCNQVAGAVSYKWKSTNGISFNDHSSPFITTDTIVNATFPANFNTGIISVAAMTPCFTGPFQTLSISKSLPALSPVSGNPSVCPIVSETYSVLPMPGVASYTWTLPQNTTGSSVTNLINVNFDTTFTGTGNICVTATSICGTTIAPVCKSIVKGPPVMPGTISGPVTGVCGQTVTYSIASAQNVSYNWTIPNGASINNFQHGSSIEVITPANMATGHIRVSSINNCGSSAFRNLTIKGIPVKPGGITTNIYPVYSLTTGVQFSSNVNACGAECTYVWNYPSSATYISGQGTPNLMLNWGDESGVVSLTATNSCGSSVNQNYVNIYAKRETGNTGQQSNSEKLQEAEEKTAYSLNLQVYPDAENKTITFTFNAPSPGTYLYSLLDDSNHIVRSGNVDSEEGVNMENIDMASLPPDIVYKLNLSNGKTSTHVNIRIK